MKYLAILLLSLNLSSVTFANDIPGKEACEKLNNTDLYKACKPLKIGVSQGTYSSSAQIKCECMSRKDNSKIIVDIGMYNY
ncbi:MAG: hypothetical protein K8R21_14780 [Leptospira sp.]|nr:hypothetical protein [Leptospira sp.]